MLKTLKNINPAHLQEFIDLIKSAETATDGCLDILAWARKTSPEYIDQLIMDNTQVCLFHETSQHYRVIHLSENDYLQLYISSYEPKYAHFQINFAEPEPFENWATPKNGYLRYLFTLTMAIMESDCTGCCNALHQMNLSKAGIYAYGNLLKTYHS